MKQKMLNAAALFVVFVGVHPAHLSAQATVILAQTDSSVESGKDANSSYTTTYQQLGDGLSGRPAEVQLYVSTNNDPPYHWPPGENGDILIYIREFDDSEYAQSAHNDCMARVKRSA